MSPLPKWLGIVSALSGIIAQFLPFVPDKYKGIAAAVAGVLAALSHSATGTGGTDPKP